MKGRRRRFRSAVKVAFADVCGVRCSDGSNLWLEFPGKPVGVGLGSGAGGVLDRGILVGGLFSAMRGVGRGDGGSSSMDGLLSLYIGEK